MSLRIYFCTKFSVQFIMFIADLHKMCLIAFGHDQKTHMPTRVCSRDSSAQDVMCLERTITALTSFTQALKFSCSYSTKFRICNIESYAAFFICV